MYHFNDFLCRSDFHCAIDLRSSVRALMRRLEGPMKDQPHSVVHISYSPYPPATLLTSDPAVEESVLLLGVNRTHTCYEFMEDWRHFKSQCPMGMFSERFVAEKIDTFNERQAENKRKLINIQGLLRTTTVSEQEAKSGKA
ncbi:hypothetical protein Tco_0390755 [Tanacetum coccineum]